ncbi:hypothetical protein ACIRVF_25020 [Kitasatospora sp. NPDC101157]|uniref:hypothetical protein n=1 Tax=Kitasatospora sp. NPDC101157 TaxID=3364098 RepID=UPI003801858A
MTTPEDSVPIRDAPPEERSEEPTHALRRRLRGVARILLGLLALALTVRGFVIFAEVFEEQHGQRTAPLCGTAEAKPGALCTARESGRVTKQWTEPHDTSTVFKLTVAREKAPAGSYTVDAAFYREVQPGTVLDLKVLRGKVFELGYQGRSQQLHDGLWPPLIAQGVLIGAGLVLLFTAPFPNDAAAMRGDFLSGGLGAAVMTVCATFFLILILWPPNVTLAIGVALWLIAAGTGYDHIRLTSPARRRRRTSGPRSPS